MHVRNNGPHLLYQTCIGSDVDSGVNISVHQVSRDLWNVCMLPIPAYFTTWRHGRWPRRGTLLYWHYHIQQGERGTTDYLNRRRFLSVLCSYCSNNNNRSVIDCFCLHSWLIRIWLWGTVYLVALNSPEQLKIKIKLRFQQIWWTCGWRFVFVNYYVYLFRTVWVSMIYLWSISMIYY